MSAEQLRPILTVYISHFHIYFPVWHCSAHRENTGCADLSTFGQGAVRLKQLSAVALTLSRHHQQSRSLNLLAPELEEL